MADIKVRIGQSDAIKVTSTGLQRGDIAFSVSGGTANVTQLDVSGQSNLNNLNLTGIATFKPNTFGATGIIVDGINEKIEVGTGLTLTSNSLVIDGSVNFETLNVSGISTLNSSGGITTTGGDLFVGSDLFVKDNLKVDGSSEFIGITTFRGGTINLGDSDTDNINVIGEFTSSLLPDTTNVFTLGSSSKRWGELNVRNVNVYGTSSFLDDLTVANGSSLNVTGTTILAGITTVTDNTDNTLGNVNTGSFQLDGGLGVAKNVTVGGGLSVTGNSFFIGEVTFSSGTNGTISIGDSIGDNVVFNADVNSSFIPNINDTYDLGSGSQKWKNLFLSSNAGIGSLHVAGVSTYVGVATFQDNVFVDGTLTAGLIDGGSF
jgi:hypothetical protein